MPDHPPRDLRDLRCVWIVDGGPDLASRPPAPEPDWVIGVDRGAEHALALDLTVAEVVGDLDSIDPRVLEQLEAQGTRIERHPTDKDRSDLDLAVARAASLSPTHIVLVSAGGGRLDHLVVGVLLLARREFAALPLVGYFGHSTMAAFPPGPTAPIGSPRGATLTLVATGGPARVTTTGTRWNLDRDQVLEPGATLGLSNEVLSEGASIEVHEGIVLAIWTTSEAGL